MKLQPFIDLDFLWKAFLSGNFSAPRMRVNQHQSSWSCAARWSRWSRWSIHSYSLVSLVKIGGFSTWLPWWYMGCDDVPGMPGDWFKLHVRQGKGWNPELVFSFYIRLIRLVADLLLSILLGCDVYIMDYWICDDLYLFSSNIAVATCIQVLPHWFILEDKTVWADLAWWQGGSSVCSGYQKCANLNLLHYAKFGDLDPATVWDTLPSKMMYSIYSAYG